MDPGLSPICPQDAVAPAVPAVAIIIPTLNEEAALDETLQAVGRLRGLVEVIVVDGGSDDQTLAIARRHGARVLEAARGRGSQLRAGAAAAQAQVLWFLHADTRPNSDAVVQILSALEQFEVIGGNFTLRFDGPGRAARTLSWLNPYLQWLGLCYGDSAIFVRRSTYEQVGGFAPLPLFEDLHLVRRLRRWGRFVRLPVPVVTSSRRFEGRSFFRTFAWWTLLQVLYWLGVSPFMLGRWYANVRTRNLPAQLHSGTSGPASS